MTEASAASPAVETPPRCDAARRSEYASEWLPDVFIVPMLGEWIEATLRTLLPSGGPTRRVLDAGCGRQPFRKLIESLGGDYRGMDVQQNVDGTVDFIGPLDSPLPPGMLAAGGFDLILCTEVLEHVADWPRAFANFHTLLAPGGSVVLTCPHFYQLHEEPYDFFRPTSYAIDWHAKHAGLEPVEIERLGNAWDVLGGVLANMHPRPIRKGLFDRIVGRLARGLLLSVIFPLLRSRWLHRRLEPKSSLYLANAAVLRKP